MLTACFFEFISFRNIRNDQKLYRRPVECHSLRAMYAMKHYRIFERNDPLWTNINPLCAKFSMVFHFYSGTNSGTKSSEQIPKVPSSQNLPN